MSQRKKAFDAVASVIPGVWNVPGTIALMDRLVDLVEAQEPQTRKVGPKGVDLIKRFEGCKLTAYPDPGTGGEPWTIGWGTTKIDGRPVKAGMKISQDRADALLEEDLQVY